MPLPRATDPYEVYTEQLVYFAARLAADPRTATLAPEVELLLAEMDQDYIAMRDARRDEMRLRALRDYQDDAGDNATHKYDRRIKGIVDTDHFVPTQIFAKGADHMTAPRGREQLERLRQVITATDNVLASAQLAADPDAAELTTVLQNGKVTLQQAHDALKPRVEGWEAQTQAVTKAKNAFNFRRQEGVSRTGVVIGQVRAAIGGSLQDAYVFTLQKRERTTDADAPADDAPADAPVPADE